MENNPFMFETTNIHQPAIDEPRETPAIVSTVEQPLQPYLGTIPIQSRHRLGSAETSSGPRSLPST